MAELRFDAAVVVCPRNLTPPEQAAVEMLVDEVARRTQRRWKVTHDWPAGPGPVIALGPIGRITEFAGPHEALLASSPAPGTDGYQIRTIRSDAGARILIAGADSRGILYGVGHLLRKLEMRRQQARLPHALDVATAPRYNLRGHQLGYRPKTNSYDGWDLSQWEQYYRDLVIFGANAVELIPPRSDDDADSPHFPLPPMEMMVAMSGLAGRYDLDVWIWYPAMDEDYGRKEDVEFAIEEWGDVFRRLPRIDAVFVPGGDPGHTPPDLLMRLLQRQTKSLQHFHPDATMWVSPQSFNAAWLEEFLRILEVEQPAWLNGVVFGPQTRIALPELRARVPARYPIRHYPDITHTYHCQYPVADWDIAYFLSEGREPINPRPRAMARIFRLMQPYTIGFLTYSEGCNDDVNKAVWSALGWDPDADLWEVLTDYSRYFIGPDQARTFARCLFDLEDNWNGPLISGERVYATLEQLEALDRTALPSTKQNWRFQQALYRGYYDAYLRARLIYETAAEERALEALRSAPRSGAEAALDLAEQFLDEAAFATPGAAWRCRIFELAEALFQSVKMQLSVDKYGAIEVSRGANLDRIDVPLNNRRWLKNQFATVRELEVESERLRGIDQILRWTDPGPGGFYDDLGNANRQPHLVRAESDESDPAFLRSVLTGYSGIRDRLPWSRHAETLYETPLQLRYTGLDPHALYEVRVTYGPEAMRSRVRLRAGDCEIHPYRNKPAAGEVLSFPIPAEVTSGGELLLTFEGEPARGGNGRGCQVAEVWLTRKSTDSQDS